MRKNAYKRRVSMMTNRFTSLTAQKRPQSAYLYSQRPVKQYRVSQSEYMNHICNSVKKTFSNTGNNLSTSIRQLTSPYITNKQKKRIDQLCIKYSIMNNPIKQKMIQPNVNVDLISRKYLKNKSKELQKKSNQKKLKAKISSFYNHNNKSQQFFEINSKSLKKLQKKQIQFPNNILPNKTINVVSELNYQFKQNLQHIPEYHQHNYMKVYQSQQQQIINSSRMEQPQQPHHINWGYNKKIEPDDWQKQQRGMKNIYVGVRRMRSKLANRNQSKSNYEQISLFLT